MFEELLKIENVEVKLTNIEGFHAKGYIFEHHNHTSFIIGSSNLTSNALKLNYEHNLFLSTHKMEILLTILNISLMNFGILAFL